MNSAPIFEPPNAHVVQRALQLDPSLLDAITNRHYTYPSSDGNGVHHIAVNLVDRPGELRIRLLCSCAGAQSNPWCRHRALLAHRLNLINLSALAHEYALRHDEQLAANRRTKRERAGK